MNKIFSPRFGAPVKRASVFGLAMAAAGLCGCARLNVADQEHLNRPSMGFAESAVHRSDATLLAQIEPGAALSGGAQNAGCSACK